MGANTGTRYPPQKSSTSSKGPTDCALLTIPAISIRCPSSTPDINSSTATSLGDGNDDRPMIFQLGLLMVGAYPPGKVTPVKAITSPGQGWLLLMFSTKMPPLESWMKKRPPQSRSVAVTTPRIETLVASAACSPESASTAEAFVNTASDSPAALTRAPLNRESKQSATMKGLFTGT